MGDYLNLLTNKELLDLIGEWAVLWGEHHIEQRELGYPDLKPLSKFMAEKGIEYGYKLAMGDIMRTSKE